MTRVIITHWELGVFVYADRGFAYWSQYGNAGSAWEVQTFMNEQEARIFIRGAGIGQDPDDYRYRRVHVDGEWATLADLARNGLGDMAGALLANVPPAGRA